MELGNMLFGNSRGNYEIARRGGYEHELYRLFEVTQNTDYKNINSYGDDFENDTFFIFPYYWGDCTCGFENQFCTVEHINCYQNELDKARKEYDNKPVPDKVYKELCKKYHQTYPYGCAVHCTCDHDKRYDEWINSIGYPNGHLESCLLLKPNFYYKPDNLEIEWYKYPLRDAYSNKPLTMQYFRNVINKCIESIKNE